VYNKKQADVHSLLEFPVAFIDFLGLLLPGKPIDGAAIIGEVDFIGIIQPEGADAEIGFEKQAVAKSVSGFEQAPDIA